MKFRFDKTEIIIPIRHVIIDDKHKIELCELWAWLQHIEVNETINYSPASYIREVLLEGEICELQEDGWSLGKGKYFYNIYVWVETEYEKYVEEVGFTDKAYFLNPLEYFSNKIDYTIFERPQSRVVVARWEKVNKD